MFDGIHGTPISGAGISGRPISGRSSDWHNAGNYVQADFEFLARDFVIPPGMTFSRASGATFIDAGGNLVEVGANVPRYQDGGLLIERIPATNGIRNPRAEGAVAPLTNAANWSIGGGVGLTITVGGLFVENGVPCIEFRCVGTPSIGFVTFFPEASGIIAASVGQRWAFSAYLRLVAGSWANTTARDLTIRSQDGALATIDNQVVASLTPNATLLRYGGSAALSASATAFVRPFLGVQFTVGQPVDFTFRIGAPQLTQGFVSSVILPPVGAPAATTRAADILDVNPALIDLDRSSIALRFRIERGGVNVPAPAGESIFEFGRAAFASNTVRLFTSSGSAFPVGGVRVAAAPTTLQTSGVGSGAFQSAAFAWGGGQVANSFNGVAPTISATSPTGVTNVAVIGVQAAGLEPSNLTLQYLRIWRGQRLTAAQVQAQSARTT